MAVIKYPQEIKVGVSPKRMFKAMVTESYTILPKIMPVAIKSIELLHGDGGAGTIRQTNFPDGAPFPYVKHRIDALDTENYVSKYTLIEGAVLGDKLESVYYEAKFEDSGDGGCIVKIISEYRTKGDAEIKEEDIKAGKDQATGFYTLAEQYLLAHPHVCA
ncbi:UNVERIFIED_CONTAM: Major allergen Pru ar 1 [Sesamum radiatum]|uniref:Major allergen Pru ar 1 n=1 Tax=Sesamum radiatum TaxID=300843 RepID=A0AAW2QGM9_SESRA